MSSFNCLALAFLIALSFASIDVGLAARHLLQQPQPQSLPSFPNLPTPSRQSFPWPGALPPLPTTLPTGLPPLPSIPSVPTIPTAFPLFLSFLHHLLVLLLEIPPFLLCCILDLV
uniref:Uncharacterized protein n=1 Tax=Gossypium raimondii TaxID=29730 RepID=A0A0D2WAN3_GOSRA|nr:hypothetical protein B456_N021600 [Gossypium raimondii]